MQDKGPGRDLRIPAPEFQEWAEEEKAERKQRKQFRVETPGASQKRGIPGRDEQPSNESH